MKRQRVQIRTREEKLKGDNCPACHQRLNGVTQVSTNSADDPNDMAGHFTMCAYCGTLLVFIDNTGKLRLMTEEERTSTVFPPAIAELLAMVRARANKDAEPKLGRN